MAGGCGSSNRAVREAKDSNMKPEEQLVLDLYDPELRGSALAELSKKRDKFTDLALLLWHSFGTMTILIQEIITVYRAVSSPATLTASALSRACHALALLQTVASHPETRTPFVQAEFHVYLYPFLDCANEGKAFENLRITSLGILGALVKVGGADMISFLVQSQVIPPCLKIMEMGTELSKIVATFIIEKILLDDGGLMFVCASVDNFFDLSKAFATMVSALVSEPSTKVLKHVIRCYLRLTDDRRALSALRISFPKALKDGTFDTCLSGDAEAVQWLQQLLDKLKDGSVEGAPLRGPAEGGSACRGPPPRQVPADAVGGSSRGAYVGNKTGK